MMYLLDSVAIHSELTITRLCLLLKYGIHIVCIIIPIIVIIKWMMDMFKVVMNPDEMTKSLKQMAYRLIAALTLFFIPTFANACFKMVEEYNPELFTSYYTNADTAQIAFLEEEYAKAVEAEQALNSAELKEAEKRQAEEMKKKQEQLEEQRRQEAQQNQNTTNNNNNTNNSTGSYDTSGEANGTYGSVTYENGVFTIPNRRATSDADIPKQSGSYGLNPIFAERLDKLIADAKAQGYNITVTSGWRSYSSQASLWNNSNRACSERGKWVACPGGSRHGFAIAADLSFNGTSCSGGWDCNAAAKWVHDNAPNYGLKFRMSWEPWHIEPDNVQGGSFGSCQAPC